MTTTLSRTWGSAQTNGIGVKIAAESAPGTTVHVAPSTTGVNDEVLLYAANITSVDGWFVVVVTSGANVDEFRVGLPHGQGQVLVRAPLLLHAATISCYVETGLGNSVYAWADVVRETAS